MLKRAFDFIASAIGLVVLSPVLLLLALLIKLTSPGPVFHRGTRVGRYGKPFPLYKFRSMVVNAAQMGPAVTVTDDPRITPVGRLLRRTKLDELPQLINVLRGDMSLVGPRPEDPKYVALYTDEQRRVLEVRPGITSPASVAYRSEETLLSGEDWERAYVERILPAKLATDLEYTSHASLWTDVKLIVQTLHALFHHKQVSWDDDQPRHGTK
jgi:lipopolysaccharide/colanic/teichoic acid biosynthesis glycosyltransferase